MQSWIVKVEEIVIIIFIAIIINVAALIIIMEFNVNIIKTSLAQFGDLLIQ